MPTREGIIDFVQFAVILGMIGWASLGLHEWFHLTLLQIFGGQGHIIMTFYGAAVVIDQPSTHMSLMTFAGGWGVALFFSVLAFFDWWHRDVPEWAALLPTIAGQATYGTFEGIFEGNIPQTQYVFYGQIVTIIAFALTAVYAMWIAANYGVADILKGKSG